MFVVYVVWATIPGFLSENGEGRGFFSSPPASLGRACRFLQSELSFIFWTICLLNVGKTTLDIHNRSKIISDVQQEKDIIYPNM